MSEFQPGKPQDEYKVPGTQIITLVKKPVEKPQKAQFFPRIKISPVDKIIKESNEN